MYHHTGAQLRMNNHQLLLTSANVIVLYAVCRLGVIVTKTLKGYIDQTSCKSRRRSADMGDETIRAAC